MNSYHFNHFTKKTPNKNLYQYSYHMKIRWEGTSSVWTSQDFSKINCAPLPKAFPYFMQSINFTVICLVYKMPTSMMEVDGVAIHIFGMSIARYISAVCLLMVICLQQIWLNIIKIINQYLSYIPVVNSEVILCSCTSSINNHSLDKLVNKGVVPLQNCLRDHCST